MSLQKIKPYHHFFYMMPIRTFHFANEVVLPLYSQAPPRSRRLADHTLLKNKMSHFHPLLVSQTNLHNESIVKSAKNVNIRKGIPIIFTFVGHAIHFIHQLRH